MRKTSCPLLSESERALSPKIRIIRWGGVGEVHRVEVYRSWKVLLPFAFKEFNKADDLLQQQPKKNYASDGQAFFFINMLFHPFFITK